MEPDEATAEEAALEIVKFDVHAALKLVNHRPGFAFELLDLVPNKAIGDLARFVEFLADEVVNDFAVLLNRLLGVGDVLEHLGDVFE